MNYSSYVGPRSARAIQEDKFALGDLKFYLEGKSKTATADDYSLAVVTVTDGKFTVSLDPAEWVLTLYACKSDVELTDATKLNKAVLVASAFVDLKRHNNSAAFTLSAGNLTTPAAVKVTVTASWYTGDVVTNYTPVSAGLYELVSGKVITDTSDASSVKTLTFTTGVATYSVSNIKPGTYTFAVTFKGNAADANYKDEELVWSDIIIIEPGHDIDEAVTIPKLIDDKPDAPTNFEAYYAKPNNEGWYALGFKWKDNSYSERYFELQVVDLTASGSSAALLTSTDWDTTAVGKTVTLYNNDCRTSAKSGSYTAPAGDPAADTFAPSTEVESVKYYIAGGLEKNNTNFVIKVPTGTNYSARIRAVNLTGKSDWVYVTRATTKPTATSLKTAMADNAFINDLADKDVGVFNAASKALNLYMLTYDLNGGAYKDTSDVSTMENIVRFDSTSRNYITITESDPVEDPKKFNIEEDGTALGTNLMRSGFYWSEWYTIGDDGVTTTTVSDASYTGTTDVVLYAKYALKFEGSVDVFGPRDYELYTDWITCVNVSNANAAVSWPDDTDHRNNPTDSAVVAGKIDGTTASKLKWTVKVSSTATPALPTGTPIESGFKYDEVILEIRSADGSIMVFKQQDNVTFGTASTFGPYDISKWEGFYNVKFIAYYGGQAVGSKTYVLRVTN